MATEKLCKRFIEGLEEYELTLEDMKRFRYAGGSWHKEGLRIINKYFFEIGFTEEQLPNYKTKCVCHTKIKKNCYITDGERILVIGNCCKNKFLPVEKRGKTCERCGKPHKNRNDNKCKECRERCECGARLYNGFIKCFTCRYGRECENCKKPHLNKIVNRCDTCRIGVCDECDKKCRPCFEKCYTCAYLKKT